MNTTTKIDKRPRWTYATTRHRAYDGKRVEHPWASSGPLTDLTSTLVSSASERKWRRDFEALDPMLRRFFLARLRRNSRNAPEALGRAQRLFTRSIIRITHRPSKDLPVSPRWNIRDDWLAACGLSLASDLREIRADHLQRLFYLYDAGCLSNGISTILRRGGLRPVIFDVGARFRRYIGLVQADHFYPRFGDVRVRIASARIMHSSPPGQSVMQSGIPCNGPVDMFVVTVEHEMVHVIQSLMHGYGGHGRDFVDLAWRLFGHINAPSESE